jgi:outer membrane protein assembly factor BamE (lipoprotein component of BamABCDE complex)
LNPDLHVGANTNAVMAKYIFREQFLSSFVILFLFAAGLTGCNNSNISTALSGSKLVRENFDKIHEGASKEQVKAILGEPTTTEVSDKIIYKRTTWRYTDKDKYINLTFKNDELDSKDTNLGT